jgi:hypothetical protein
MDVGIGKLPIGYLDLCRITEYQFQRQISLRARIVLVSQLRERRARTAANVRISKRMPQ